MKDQTEQWKQYKELAHSPSVFSRWMLQQIQQLANFYDSPIIHEWVTLELEKKPIPKPDEHIGDSLTDLYQLNFSKDRVQKIVDLLVRATSEDLHTFGDIHKSFRVCLLPWEYYLKQFSG